MNKRGFAISVILYTIVFFIITIFYILLGTVKARYNVSGDLKNSIMIKLNGIEYIYNEFGNDTSVNILRVNPNGGRVLFNGEVITTETGVAKYAGGTVELPNAERDNGALSSSGTYTVSYNANGGSSTPASQTVLISSAEKYTFRSWDGLNNCGEIVDGVYTFPDSNGTICTKTASWIIDVVLSVEPITLPAAITNQGKIFLGWKSSVDNEVYPAGSIYTLTRDTVMTAQWDEVWAENLSYDNTNSKGVDCTGDDANVQCALDKLAELINR